MKARAWHESIRKKDVHSYQLVIVPQVDTNIPDLETKVSVESLKAVTRPQVISDGQHHVDLL